MRGAFWLDRCKKMERLLQGKIQSVLAFLQTVVQAAVKGLLARSDPSPKRFFKGRGCIMVVVPCGSCSYDKMNLALAGLNPLIGGILPLRHLARSEVKHVV